MKEKSFQWFDIQLRYNISVTCMPNINNREILGLYVTEMARFDWESMLAFPLRHNCVRAKRERILILTGLPVANV